MAHRSVPFSRTIFHKIIWLLWIFQNEYLISELFPILFCPTRCLTFDVTLKMGIREACISIWMVTWSDVQCVSALKWRKSINNFELHLYQCWNHFTKWDINLQRQFFIFWNSTITKPKLHQMISPFFYFASEKIIFFIRFCCFCCSVRSYVVRCTVYYRCECASFRWHDNWKFLEQFQLFFVLFCFLFFVLPFTLLDSFISTRCVALRCAVQQDFWNVTLYFQSIH